MPQLMPNLRSMLIRRTVLAGAALTLATAGAGGAYMHLAASPSPSAGASASAGGTTVGAAHRHRRHHLLGALIRDTAQHTNQTPEQVVLELKAGKSLDQIAGSKAGQVKQDVLAEAKSKLDRAVSRGHLDATKEATLLAKLSGRLDTLMTANLSEELQHFGQHRFGQHRDDSPRTTQPTGPTAAA